MTKQIMMTIILMMAIAMMSCVDFPVDSKILDLKNRPGLKDSPEDDLPRTEQYPIGQRNPDSLQVSESGSPPKTDQLPGTEGPISQSATDQDVDGTYAIVDSGQIRCYNDSIEITCGQAINAPTNSTLHLRPYPAIFQRIT